MIKIIRILGVTMFLLAVSSNSWAEDCNLDQLLPQNAQKAIAEQKQIYANSAQVYRNAKENYETGRIGGIDALAKTKSIESSALTKMKNANVAAEGIRKSFGYSNNRPDGSNSANSTILPQYKQGATGYKSIYINAVQGYQDAKKIYRQTEMGKIGINERAMGINEFECIGASTTNKMKKAYAEDFPNGTEFKSITE